MKSILRTQKTRVVIAAFFASALSTTPSFAADANQNSAPAMKTALPRVIVLTTGGTIASVPDARSAIGYNAGGITGQQLVASVPGLEKLATVQTEQISNIGSQDMNDKVWFALAKRIRKVIDNNEADGVVITHGTDTMEETSFFLQSVVRTDKLPIVLVGSMRSSGTVSADGPANLYEAIEVAVNPRSKGRGVMVVLNDTIHSARGVTKTNTTSVQTFMSPNSGPIGYVDPASVRFLTPVIPAVRQPYNLPANGQLPRVEIVYSHANMDAVQINNAVKDNAKGIVLAGVGDGNTSKEALDALEAAAKKGVVVVRSTRVLSGFVNRNVEVEDDKSGFVTAMDLNPQKARLLTQILISNGVTAPEKVQEAFEETY